MTERAIGAVESNSPTSSSKMMLALKVLSALSISLITLVACVTYHPSFGTPWSELTVSNPDLKKGELTSFLDPEITRKVTDPSKVEELQTFLERYQFGWFLPIPESPGAGYLVEVRTSQGRLAWLAISPLASHWTWISWQKDGNYFDYDSARMHTVSPAEYRRILEVLELTPRPTIF